MSEIRMMSTTGMLGYGFTETAFNAGLARDLDFIACDAGSQDPGPYYLGAGTAFVSRAAAKRDLKLMINGARGCGIPVLVGSAGGSGGEPHLAWLLDIAREIAAEGDHHLRIAAIHAEPDRDYLKRQTAAGRIVPLGPIDPLTPADIDDSSRIVAMMGLAPYQRALRDGADVVIAGRSSDAAIFAAIPLMADADAGLAWHLGKIIECAAQVAEPRTGQDCVLGTLADDHFVVEPAHPDKRCTRMRIAAHTLYENPHPYRLAEPEGTLDTSAAVYEQIDDRRVRVSGSRFEPAARYSVKLEGVKREGHRSVFFAGVRDPGLIAVIDQFVDDCRARAAVEAQSLGIDPTSYRVGIKIYGRDAVMGALEPCADTPHEIAILADVVAADAETSRTVIAKVRYALLHTDFPGRKCISGNLAIPFSPSDLDAGEAYSFNVWHRMEIDDPLEPFTIEWIET